MSMELYPPGPPSVPADLTAAPAGYQTRAYVAVAALFAFCAAYFALTGWFGYKGYTLLRDAFAGGKHAFAAGVAGLVCAFLAVFLGKALLSLRRGNHDELIEVRGEDPALIEFVHRVADDAGAPRPHKVFLSPGVTASVFYDLSILNFIIPSRKNLVIGLGLVNVLTLSELKAVLGHEFGHFAQRSMAVSRYIYTGQQIAAHIVASRGVLDNLLLRLSQVDIRIAWIGWGMRIIVWSVRSLMDQFFRVVIVAERALSRHMELQADLVAVSLTGSDALVHALYKLGAADEAWDRAASIAGGELAEDRAVPDLFEMQTRVLHHYRETLGQGAAVDVPAMSAAQPQAHRIFEAGLGHPPQMWSTHPPNDVREANAKRRYVAAPLDDRPAWSLFVDPAATSARVTAHLLQAGDNVARLDRETGVAKVDDYYDHRFLDHRYRGLYMGRRVTRAAAQVAALYAPQPPDDPAAALAGLYAPSVADDVKRAQELDREWGELDAIVQGALTAAGGIVHFRGQPLRRKELPEARARVEREREHARAVLVEHDRACRTAYWAAAQTIGHGWAEYLEGLTRVLHYAEHVEADVDDAQIALKHLVDVVLADGHVTDGERRRVVVAASEVEILLRSVHYNRHALVLPARVAQRMGVANWAAAVGEEYGLVPPSAEDIGDFLEVEGGWFSAYSNALGSLRHEVLETLLEAEAYVARCAHTQETPIDAPPPPQVPAEYRAFCHGAERDKQTSLNWWERFVLAEGYGPGLARFAVAGTIVGGVAMLGGVVATPTIQIYNGLDRAVVVAMGAAEATVGAHDHASLEFELVENLSIDTTTLDGAVVERFEPEIDNPLIDYVYNVAGAASLVEWKIVYGGGDPTPTVLGPVRWTKTTADYVFEDPPETISTRSKTATRRALEAYDLDFTVDLDELVPNVADRTRVAGVHLRWDEGPGAVMWLARVDDPAALREPLLARMREAPGDVQLGLAAQRFGSRQEVCAEQAERAAAAPGDPDLQYVALSCIDDFAARRAALREAATRFVDHPWFLMETYRVALDAGEVEKAGGHLARAQARLPGPALPGHAALERARIRRWAQGSEAIVDDLLAASPQLQALASIEAGGAEGVSVYTRLSQGDLETTLPDAADDPRALRLIAASEGAPKEVIDRALELPVDDAIDDAILWISIALAKREGADAAALLAVAEDRTHQPSVMLVFTDPDKLGEDPERLFEGLSAEDRGVGRAMALVTLGPKAPPQWRQDVRRLLFAPERPYFEVVEPKPAGDAAP